MVANIKTNVRFLVVVAWFWHSALSLLGAGNFIPSCDFGLNEQGIYHTCSPFVGQRSQILFGSGDDNDSAACNVIPSLIRDLVVSRVSNEMVVISDSTVRIFSVDRNGPLTQKVAPLVLHDNEMSLAANCTESTFAVGDAGGKVNLIKNDTLQRPFFPFIKDRAGQYQSVDFVAFVAKDQIVAANKLRSDIWVCDLSGNALRNFPKPSEGHELTSLTANTNGLVVAGSAGGLLTVYNTTNTVNTNPQWQINELVPICEPVAAENKL